LNRRRSKYGAVVLMTRESKFIPFLFNFLTIISKNTIMKLTVTRYVEQKETIDVELPYYYKNDANADRKDKLPCICAPINMTYGKITKDHHISIQEFCDDSGLYSYDIDRSALKNLDWEFDDELKCSAEEFESARLRVLNYTTHL
jgi:hypothetical protein